MSNENAVIDIGESEGGIKAKAGKYLIFRLGTEEYGVEILKVQEIMGVVEITTVPQMPEFVKGVINLRGKIVPVTDLRLKFSMEPKEYTERTCIIVVQIVGAQNNITMGIIVDEVSEVEDIGKGQIEPRPEFGSNILTEFILGIGKVEQRVVMLLDIDKVLSQEEVESISGVENTPEPE